MKGEVVEPQRGTCDWAADDELVDIVKENGQLVRGHTLVWHSQLPAWLNNGDFTADKLREILRKHITDQVTHFKGKIRQWDVVNEAFSDDGTMRDSVRLQKLGPGCIADAFRRAHQATAFAARRVRRGQRIRLHRGGSLLAFRRWQRDHPAARPRHRTDRRRRGTLPGHCGPADPGRQQPAAGVPGLPVHDRPGHRPRLPVTP
ncbi:hypothetical protein GCM10010207_67310 [Streptomyces atratus]|nr:hypothetical protein GCM10010207_67310 [Streptomyces atratus]